jgi:hypothetical protein
MCWRQGGLGWIFVLRCYALIDTTDDGGFKKMSYYFEMRDECGRESGKNIKGG